MAPGPAMRGDGEREDRQVAQLGGRRGARRAAFVPLLAPFEDHLEGDHEEQQAAGDAEGVDRDAEQVEDGGAGEREEDQDAERRQRAAHGGLGALGRAHAGREAEEDRRQARRVDGDEEGHEGGGDGIGHGLRILPGGARRDDATRLPTVQCLPTWGLGPSRGPR